MDAIQREIIKFQQFVPIIKDLGYDCLITYLKPRTNLTFGTKRTLYEISMYIFNKETQLMIRSYEENQYFLVNLRPFCLGESSECFEKCFFDLVLPYLTK